MTKDQNMIEKSLIDTFTMIKQHRNLQNTPQFWKGSQHSQEEEASQMREKKKAKMEVVHGSHVSENNCGKDNTWNGV
jgi:uncharacterized protein YktB (UPF0637 family)